MAFANLAQAKVSSARVAAFLAMPEVRVGTQQQQPLAVTNRAEEKAEAKQEQEGGEAIEVGAVAVAGGTFSWADPVQVAKAKARQKAEDEEKKKKKKCAKNGQKK